jgi:hypothetical protein
MATGGIEVVGQEVEEASAKVLEVLEVGFADLAEEETLEARDALAVVDADLGEEPVGFAPAPGAAVADGSGAVGFVAEASGRAGGELAGLEDDARLGEVEELVGGTALFQAEVEELFQFGLGDRGQVHG